MEYINKIKTLALKFISHGWLLLPLGMAHASSGVSRSCYKPGNYSEPKNPPHLRNWDMSQKI